MVFWHLQSQFVTAPVVSKECEEPARSSRAYDPLHTHLPVYETGPLDQGFDDHVIAPAVGHSSASAGHCGRHGVSPSAARCASGWSGLYDVAVVGAVSRRDVLGAEGLRCPPCDRTLLSPDAGATRPQESGDHHYNYRFRGQYQDGRAGSIRDCRPLLYDLLADRQNRASLECHL